VPVGAILQGKVIEAVMELSQSRAAMRTLIGRDDAPEYQSALELIFVVGFVLQRIKLVEIEPHTFTSRTLVHIKAVALLFDERCLAFWTVHRRILC
jgi:hypothetical protein